MFVAKNKYSHKSFYQILSFVIPLVIYIYSLAPDVNFIDAGELAAAASNLAIAHPTGYPLFTVLGKIFTLLPFGTEIYKLNLMCAVISAFAMLLFFNLLVMLLSAAEPSISKNKNLSESIILNISLAAVLIFAFSKTYWDSSNSIEVYSLHVFFLLLNIFLFLKAIGFANHSEKNYPENEKYWLMFAFVLGLSFTNHLTTMFLAPAFLYLYFSVNGFNRISFKRILIMAIPFIAGLSFYLYLMVRAENDSISWGYPATLDKLIKHITGRQFSMLMFASSENMSAQLSYFFKNFPAEFFYFPLLFAIPGIIELYKTNKSIFIFTVLLFLFCIIWAINYNIYDIDTYFLLANIAACIWIAFGFLFIAKKFQASNNKISFAFILIAIPLLVMNFSFASKRNDFTVKDYSFNIMKSAPDSSIVFTTQWNFFASPSMYYQLVDNQRPDLIIINKELLSESWYLRFLQQHYPGLIEKSKYEMDAYMIELTKFENNPSRYMNAVTNADNQEIIKFQNTFTNFVNSLIDKNYDSKNIFTTYEIEEDKSNKFGKEYSRIPYGLLIKYSKDKNFVDDNNPEFNFTLNGKDDYYNNFVRDSYFKAYLNRANYLLDQDKPEYAEILIKKAGEIKTVSPELLQISKKLNQKKTK